MSKRHIEILQKILTQTKLSYSSLSDNDLNLFFQTLESKDYLIEEYNALDKPIDNLEDIQGLFKAIEKVDQKCYSEFEAVYKKVLKRKNESRKKTNKIRLGKKVNNAYNKSLNSSYYLNKKK